MTHAPDIERVVTRDTWPRVDTRSQRRSGLSKDKWCTVLGPNIRSPAPSQVNTPCSVPPGALLCIKRQSVESTTKTLRTNPVGSIPRAPHFINGGGCGKTWLQATQTRFPSIPLLRASGVSPSRSLPHDGLGHWAWTCNLPAILKKCWWAETEPWVPWATGPHLRPYICCPSTPEGLPVPHDPAPALSSAGLFLAPTCMEVAPSLPVPGGPCYGTSVWFCFGLPALQTLGSLKRTSDPCGWGLESPR